MSLLRARRYLLNSNLWYELPGMDPKLILACENDLLFEVPAATQIQVYHDMFIGDKQLDLYKKIAGLIINDIAPHFVGQFNELPLPEHVNQLGCLLVFELITSVQGKEVLNQMLTTRQDPFTISMSLGLFEEQNEDELQQWVEAAITANDKSVQEYKSGKLNAANAIIGAVMKLSKGKAVPKAVRELIEARLRA